VSIFASEFEVDFKAMISSVNLVTDALTELADSACRASDEIREAVEETEGDWADKWASHYRAYIERTEYDDL
jgi:hypothetical protein